MSLLLWEASTMASSTISAHTVTWTNVAMVAYLQRSSSSSSASKHAGARLLSLCIVPIGRCRGKLGSERPVFWSTGSMEAIMQGHRLLSTPHRAWRRGARQALRLRPGPRPPTRKQSLPDHSWTKQCRGSTNGVDHWWQRLSLPSTPGPWDAEGVLDLIRA